jgi:hypothetical protein
MLSRAQLLSTATGMRDFAVLNIFSDAARPPGTFHQNH